MKVRYDEREITLTPASLKEITMAEKVRISFEYDLPLVTCAVCKMEWVVLSVVRGVSEDGERYQDVMPLAKLWYCPRCGNRMQDKSVDVIVTDSPDGRPTAETPAVGAWLCDECGYFNAFEICEKCGSVKGETCPRK